MGRWLSPRRRRHSSTPVVFPFPSPPSPHACPGYALQERRHRHVYSRPLQISIHPCSYAYPSLPVCSRASSNWVGGLPPHGAESLAACAASLCPHSSGARHSCPRTAQLQRVGHCHGLQSRVVIVCTHPAPADRLSRNDRGTLSHTSSQYWGNGSSDKCVYGGTCKCTHGLRCRAPVPKVQTAWCI